MVIEDRVVGENAVNPEPSRHARKLELGGNTLCAATRLPFRELASITTDLHDPISKSFASNALILSSSDFTSPLPALSLAPACLPSSATALSCTTAPSFPSPVLEFFLRTADASGHRTSGLPGWEFPCSSICGMESSSYGPCAALCSEKLFRVEVGLSRTDGWTRWAYP
jgi:hypothetical protein